MLVELVRAPCYADGWRRLGIDKRLACCVASVFLTDESKKPSAEGCRSVGRCTARRHHDVDGLHVDHSSVIEFLQCGFGVLAQDAGALTKSRTATTPCMARDEVDVDGLELGEAAEEVAPLDLLARRPQ